MFEPQAGGHFNGKRSLNAAGPGRGGGRREEREEQKSGYVIGMKLCEVEL